MSLEESFQKPKQTTETKLETLSNPEKIKQGNLSKILEELLQRPELEGEIVHDTLFKFKRFSDFLFSQFEAGKIDSYILKIKSDSFFEQKIEPLSDLDGDIKIKIKDALKQDRINSNNNQISQNS